MTMDTACSSGMEALCYAVMSIKEGHCESAVVGACNIILNTDTSKSVNILKMLSPDGACKSFDASGMFIVLNK